MRYLLHPSRVELLAQLAWSKALLAFDFDGTLAPIVRDPEKAAMTARTRRLFERACLLFPVAVISGRSRPDVAARLGGARVKYVVGNHGLEPGPASPDQGHALDEARDRLRQLVAKGQGLDLEDKGSSLAVHFRRSRTKLAAQAAIRKAVQDLSVPLRMIPGKCVINVLPGHGPNKGDALRLLRTREGADVAFYVGDDVTDEDVFRLDEPGRLLTVRVGRSSASAAEFFLHDQPEMDGLLRRLIRLRESMT